MAAAIAAAASLRCLGVKNASSPGRNLHAPECQQQGASSSTRKQPLWLGALQPMNPGLSTVTRQAASSDLVSKEARAMTPNLLTEDWEGSLVSALEPHRPGTHCQGCGNYSSLPVQHNFMNKKLSSIQRPT